MTSRFFCLLLAFAAVTGAPKDVHAQTIGTVTLTWTAPGDDSLSGTASLYDVRYSFEPINEENFPFAGRVAVIRPARSGSTETFTVAGLLPNYDYYFAIRTADDVGNWSRVSNLAFRPGRGIKLEQSILKPFGLSAAWPNPAVWQANFNLTMPRAGEAHVDVFDASGRRVTRIAGGPRDAGTYRVGWRLDDMGGRPVPAGIYLVRATLGSTVVQRRVTVVR